MTRKATKTHIAVQNTVNNRPLYDSTKINTVTQSRVLSSLGVLWNSGNEGRVTKRS